MCSEQYTDGNNIFSSVYFPALINHLQCNDFLFRSTVAKILLLLPSACYPWKIQKLS